MPAEGVAERVTDLALRGRLWKGLHGGSGREACWVRRCMRGRREWEA